MPVAGSKAARRTRPPTTMHVREATADTSDLIIWSRSVYGESDLGVNRKRVAAWLDALDKILPPSSER